MRQILKRNSLMAFALSMILVMTQIIFPMNVFAAAGDILTVQTYCKMTGKVQGTIAGGVTRVGKVGLMAVDGFSSDGDNTFKIIKEIDKATPKILKAYATNEGMTEVALYVYKYRVTSTGQVEFVGYTIKLLNAEIVGHRIFKETYTDTHSLPTYEEITFKYRAKQEINGLATANEMNLTKIPSPGTYCKIFAEDGKQISGSIYQKNYNGMIYVDNYDMSIRNSDGYDLPDGSSSSVIKITKELDKASPILSEVSSNMGQLSEITLDTYVASTMGPATGIGAVALKHSYLLRGATVIDRRVYKERGNLASQLRTMEEITVAFQSVEITDVTNNETEVYESIN